MLFAPRAADSQPAHIELQRKWWVAHLNVRVHAVRRVQFDVRDATHRARSRGGGARRRAERAPRHGGLGSLALRCARVLPAWAWRVVGRAGPAVRLGLARRRRALLRPVCTDGNLRYAGRAGRAPVWLSPGCTRRSSAAAREGEAGGTQTRTELGCASALVACEAPTIANDDESGRYGIALHSAVCCSEWMACDEK
jgi:hypothetical protein